MGAALVLGHHTLQDVCLVDVTAAVGRQRWSGVLIVFHQVFASLIHCAYSMGDRLEPRAPVLIAQLGQLMLPSDHELLNWHAVVHMYMNRLQTQSMLRIFQTGLI